MYASARLNVTFHDIRIAFHHMPRSFLPTGTHLRTLAAALFTIVFALGGAPRAHAVGCAGGSALLRVPADCDLQTAIDAIGDDGVIEVAAGTYSSPNAVIGGYGFRINMERKGFTIRGIGNVYLDGGGARDILQIQNFSRSDGKLVTFENLTFRNGLSQQDGIAGAVTIMNGDAQFTDCTFENNAANPNSTGGGALLLGGSVVGIKNSTFRSNSAKNEGGAISIKGNSTLRVAGSTFTSNRVDLPGHRNTASGGAIHVGDSYLSVDGSTFDGNRAGYVAGAIFVIGTWSGDMSTPNASAYLWNSTFRNNIAQRDAQAQNVGPTEGGAVHAEDQSVMYVRYSHFENNAAGIGGAVNGYRAKLIVDASYFVNNKATAVGSGTGFGGAISATSSDTQGFDGDANRPSVSLQVNDSLFEATENVAQSAGAIYATGDTAREYGNGVGQQSNISANRATVRITNSAFHGFKVTQINTTDVTGIGAGVFVDLTDLRIEDSMFLRNFADGAGTSTSSSSGNNGSGGALAVINNSVAVIEDTVFAENVADKWGGAAYLVGSDVVIRNSTFTDNDIHPDVVEGENRAYGSAVFSAPFGDPRIPATGRIENSLISGDNSIHIWDDDRRLTTEGTINEMRYNGNTFWGSGFGQIVYRNPVLSWQTPFNPSKTVAELNTLVVDRVDPQPDTEKSQVNNTMATSEPTAAKLLVIPQIVLDNAAVPTCAVYAWQGPGTATLNGAPLAQRSGVSCTNPQARGVAAAATSYVLQIGSVTSTDAVAVVTPATYVPFTVR
jgi:predicted outer membrane repeat protein